MKQPRGLTLVEMLIASTIMLIVFAMVYSAFLQTQNIALRNEMDAEIIQNARIGVDEVSRKIRMLGYGRDRARGQAAIIEAAPFQLSVNADVDAAYPALTATGLIKLYDSSDYVSPTNSYTTGAETLRWTLDRNNDGLVDEADTHNPYGKPETPNNPHDMVLMQEINGGRSDQITIGLRGPFDAYGQRTNAPPLFQYWVDDSPRGFTLLGDEDGNGVLEGDEMYFRAITSQQILQRIRRIDVTLTAESDGFDPLMPGQRRRIRLGSTVGLRNRP